jgi:EAL domain-containing protein (putative c-di-GMP-specific phosphodiesterase class I)
MGLVRPEVGDPLPTSDDLLRQADVSMYAGKRVGKDTAVIYRPSLGVSTGFPTALRKADGGVPPGFGLVYQPVVRLPEGTPVAVEALARWTAPNGTDIQPDAFVAAAEAAGLGAALDAMVLELACQEVAAAGVDRSSTSPTPPHRSVDSTRSASRSLSTIRCRATTRTYRHALPVQIIKLDRGLAIGSEPNRIVTLYRSVIRLCGALGLGVIAEGIESSMQAETVYAAGCRLAQGHLFGRAASIAELDLVSSKRTVPAIDRD